MDWGLSLLPGVVVLGRGRSDLQQLIVFLARAFAERKTRIQLPAALQTWWRRRPGGWR